MMKKLQISIFLVALLGGTVAEAQDEAEREAIRKEVASYVEAYNKRDAKKLVSHWLPEGVYVRQLTGEQISGHEALEKEFLSLFEESEGVTLAAETETIAFVSPNVAVENGNAEVTHADKSKSSSRYSAVYVKRDGKWLIDRISEESNELPDSHGDELAELEWMVGDWVDVIGDVTVTIECHWTKNRNYICRAFEIAREGVVENTGMQIIGWDAKQKHIRSWLFDSDSTYIEGTWTKNEDRWVVQSVATMVEGESGSSTSIFRPIDESSYGWQKVNRIVDGQLLPDIEEVVIHRK